MSDYVDVIDEIKKTGTRINNAIIELNRLAKLKAQTEKEYQVAKLKKIVELKEDGVANTIIPDLVKGYCAEELFQRDLIDAQFTAVRDSISALQSQSTMLQSVLKIQRDIEWSG